MKRRLIFISLVLLMTLVLTLSASAQEISKQDELLTYVEEKIVPVIVGVITSAMALIGTLKGILKALKNLEGAKNSFDEVNKELTANTKKELESISEKYESFKERIKDVPLLDEKICELGGRVDELILQINRLSKITSLGFLQNEELVKSGAGREIAILAQEGEADKNEKN